MEASSNGASSKGIDVQKEHIVSEKHLVKQYIKPAKMGSERSPQTVGNVV